VAQQPSSKTALADGTGGWRRAAIAVSSGAPATDGGGGAAWPSRDGEVERLEEGATAAVSSRSWRAKRTGEGDRAEGEKASRMERREASARARPVHIRSVRWRTCKRARTPRGVACLRPVCHERVQAQQANTTAKLRLKL